ncbi:hypothetical protein GTO27_00775 [Candidatus Bathyarchaeota archaeon]|nr:hypothetical protein [Candidatus Bathyarchaeota archaeon]
MKITGPWALIAYGMCGIYVIGFIVLGVLLEPRGVPTSVVIDIIGVIEAIFFVIMVRLMRVTADEWKKVIDVVFSITPQKLKALLPILGIGLLVIFVLCEAEGMCMLKVSYDIAFQLAFNPLILFQHSRWLGLTVWLGFWFAVAFNIVKIVAGKLKKGNRKETIISDELESEKLKDQMNRGSITQREYEQLLLELSNLSVGIITLGEYEQKKKKLLEKSDV